MCVCVSSVNMSILFTIILNTKILHINCCFYRIDTFFDAFDFNLSRGFFFCQYRIHSMKWVSVIDFRFWSFFFHLCIIIFIVVFFVIFNTFQMISRQNCSKIVGKIEIYLKSYVFSFYLVYPRQNWKHGF